MNNILHGFTMYIAKMKKCEKNHTFLSFVYKNYYREAIFYLPCP